MLKTIAAALVVLLLTLGCGAMPPDAVDAELARYGAGELQEAIPQQAGELAEIIGLSELSFGEMLRLTPDELYRAVKAGISSALLQARASLFSIIATVLLCALLGCFSQGAAAPVFESAAVLSVTAALCVPAIECVREAADTIVEASMFMLSYVPVYTTVITAGGQPTSAAGYGVSVMAAAQMVGQLAAQLMIPLCGVYLALCLTGGISKNEGLLRLSGAIRKFVNWSLTLAMTLFAGLLTLQSFMTSAADGATVKTTKFLVGTFVPVVGSAISDALSAAQGSIRLIRATVGTFGIVVAALTFLPILLRVTVLRGVVALASAAGETLGAGQVKGVLGGFASVLSVLTGMLLSMVLLMIISTAVMLSAGGGV